MGCFPKCPLTQNFKQSSTHFRIDIFILRIEVTLLKAWFDGKCANCIQLQELHQSLLIFKTRNTTESNTKETEEEYLGVAGRSIDSQEIMIKATQPTEVDVVDSKVAWLQYMGYYQA